MSYGKFFKKARLDAGFTQVQVAKFLNVTEVSYQRYEMSQQIPRLDGLIKLADFYNISLDELVGRKFPK